MRQLIRDAPPLKTSPHQDQLPAINLTICRLEYKDKIFWLGGKQEKRESYFKKKVSFLAAEDQLTLVVPQRVLTLGFQIDFIAAEENESVFFVFNRKQFETIFNYYELLKEHVRSKSTVISGWKFVSNPMFIQERLDNTYVFKGLGRIIDDDKYMAQIEKANPRTLKKRLLEKCSSRFSESDFNGNQLVVTSSNLNNIIKMIAKEFRYNFFSDQAED